MTTIKSLADLDQLRQAALQNKQRQAETGDAWMTVDLSTPALASGASRTLKTILDYVAARKLEHVHVQQTANIGYDSLEPIVRVVIGGNPEVTYGKVTEAVAERILTEHLLGGKVVEEYRIEQLLAQLG
ncbi:MAG: hypothetical protein B6D39_03500 [Anaerolineae bacterium UTCFX2]|mgnify:CR=1 FL=1|jgi:NADP-reducing hydrogenase subunit HndB|nr:(2Fe-2S) ferredoxin domain-containing protein [Anaerolineae bacterium]MCZ7553847.1 (2Fe-2S) ferredoxin domain-containing protein [Anaerolineales bacterium]OQY93170.1 MAG: hypothetical protein B6D39_03500 [Anaerolineae bacterium UTCFX2]